MPRKKTAENAKTPATTSVAGPKAGRLRLPPEYGAPTHDRGLLPWSHVIDRMEKAAHYWVCTVTPEGRPHATPVDGIWIDGALYFGGSPKTRRSRNLESNSAVCVHLESASDVVMLQGDARVRTPDRALVTRLMDLSKKKYGYAPPPAAYETGVHVFRPSVAFAWTSLPKDATRWRIGG